MSETSPSPLPRPASLAHDADHGARVSGMFDAIAGRYDLMNTVMTWGQEPRLVRRTVERANVPAAARVLDLATGTGDLALEILKQHPDARVVAADFAPEMMEVGRTRPNGNRIEWVEADALALPFADGEFDSLTHGYLLRNVADIPAALAEQFRVLRPGGWVAALETSPAPDNLIKPFSSFYMHRIMPRLARLITDRAEAYEYLSSSTRAFHTPEEIAGMLADAGFVNIGHELHMFGTLATHWAMKPLD
ncbi:ubiquinone/menaquinone biosynthesis methyltransferase [Micrococcus porci]|uniref:ubiquinone/menaquinone biosynthesis methyltransferase n=1 Tax=Micrococcus porci TaxID=2856555 RepID=UPI003CF04DF8